MKVTFSYPTRTLSGKEDDTVFGAYRNKNICLARKYSGQEITENNHNLGAICKNLAIVYKNVSPTYLQDLKTYALKNGKENIPKTKIPTSSFGIFMKMMRAWMESDPTHVDLSTVTIADIVALDAEVRTIKRAIDAGFLQTVSSYAALTAGIQ